MWRKKPAHTRIQPVIEKKAVPPEIFIARQPIFDRDRRVTAYELLYRNSDRNQFDDSVDGSLATKRVITEALLNFGMDALTEGQQGYVNFTEELLLEKMPLLLNRESFVIEVLEDVRLTPQMLERLTELRDSGYTVVLDDYAGAPLTGEQLACFDLVKIDFMLLPKEKRAAVGRALSGANKRMLAEKIETAEEFQEALDMGCTLFQGFYFARPTLLRKRRQDIASSSAVRLARVLSDEDYDLQELAEIVRPDAHLTYKLLKRMNTVEYYRGHPIQSVEQALTRMGMVGIRRWVALVLMEIYTGDSEDEFIRTALVRGRFCELLAEAEGKRDMAPDAFLVGMLSLMDIPGEDGFSPIDDLSLSREILDGMRGENGPLARYLAIAEHYEEGDWEWLDGQGVGQEAGGLYRQAITYAENTLK